MDLITIRPEVIEARRSRRAGAIVLARPVPMKVAGAAACVVLASLVALLAFGEYTSKVRVAGQLSFPGGAIKVVAPQFGRITARHVHEGDSVRAGQLLFDLSAERIGANGSVDARIGAALVQRRQQIAQRRDNALQQLAQRFGALTDQQRSIDAELAAHRGAIGIEEEQVKAAAATFERYNKLARRGFVAPALLTQYRSAVNVERAKRAALVVNLQSAQRALLQVKQEAATLAGQGKLARSEAEQSFAALEQEAAEQDGRSAMRVGAPQAGVVTAFAYGVGQSVPAGGALAIVLPAGSALEAQLLLPSRAKATVAVGQRVHLRIDAFPYQKYGLVAGTVTQVERNPINDGAAGGGGAAAPPMYRVTVALSTTSLTVYGKPTPFEPGMTLEADIFNDRRRLIAWVFDPLISAAKDRAP